MRPDSLTLARFRPLFAIPVICGLAMSILGCGSGGPAPIPLYKTKGVVTYKGQPVKGATVIFEPEKGTTATGQTDANGEFVMTTSGRSGVAAGKSKVMIMKAAESDGADVSKLKAEDLRDMSTGKRPMINTKKGTVPAKYGSPATTPLEAGVDKNEASNKFDFILVD